MCKSWERPTGGSVLATVLAAHESSSDEEVSAVQQLAPEVPTPLAVQEADWVPLSVRLALAREKLEAEATAKKMAQVVAPLTLDSVSGLPCIPEKCLPIKHYNRWLDANNSRASMVERRRSVARIQANKVMRALAASSSPLVFENYSAELSALADQNHAQPSNISAGASSTLGNELFKDCNSPDVPILANSSSAKIISVELFPLLAVSVERLEMVSVH